MNEKREFVYSQKTGKVLGTYVNDEVVPLPPVPEGKVLVALIDECCSTLEDFFGKFWESGKITNRICSDLRQVDGQHSELLMDGMQRWGVQHPDTKGVRSWITEGSLRSHDQLIPVINEFVTNIQFRQRNRLAKADWVFDPDGLAAMGVKFGLPEPPTQEQRAAKSVENQAQYEQHCKYANEEHNRMAQYERESEITRRKKKVVERICALFFPFDGIDIDGETLSPEYLAMQQRRRQLRTSITNFVGFSVDEGEDDDEILKGVTMLKEIRFAGFGGDWLSAPLDPLDSGKRMFFTKPAEIVAYYGSDEAQKLLDADFKFCTQLMMDGRWSVSVVAKTEDDLARESEIDAEGERK